MATAKNTVLSLFGTERAFTVIPLTPSQPQYQTQAASPSLRPNRFRCGMPATSTPTFVALLAVHQENKPHNIPPRYPKSRLGAEGQKRAVMQKKKEI